VGGALPGLTCQKQIGFSKPGKSDFHRLLLRMRIGQDLGELQ
jgi:hypothetical protein